MPYPEAIWQTGERWRDLTGDAEAAGSVTVISEHGTARLLDLAGGRHSRVPLEGGHRMYLDLLWRPLEQFRLTPCGLSLNAGLSWAQGTPVQLVLAGLDPWWIRDDRWRRVAAAVISGEAPQPAPGHPPEPCGAAYCSQLA